jgi:acyl-coenzyme A synthetase/AMP-(fatty) acid ligase
MSFWVDYSRNIDIEYNDLFSKLLRKGNNNIYIKEENPFDVFLNLLRNFVNMKISVILDSDFSDKEILDLGITNNDLLKGEYTQYNLFEKFSSFDEIILFYEKNKENIGIEIYTSGTTGRPKKVVQSYENLTRAIKTGPSFIDNIWGFAYNPTHFAGIQVFLQAFYNQNELVYIFNLDYQLVYRSMLERKVTHLSCTPTFMKIFLNYIDEPLESVTSLTFGGEKFNLHLENKIKATFPEATLKNVYASTEAGSLFRSDGVYFRIPKKYKEFIKIEIDELYIHKKLLGKSSSFTLDGDWYGTGDLVEFIDHERFLFKSRKSEMINVGGYKVNPTEIENIIKEIKGVKDVAVFGRKNSIMGQIIVANIITEDAVEEIELKQEIKKICKSQLQDFKIPRIIKFVELFDLTRTGKIKKT